MKNPAKKAGKTHGELQPVLEWKDIPGSVVDCIEALKDRKVEDIRVYDLRGFTPFCDFVILGTAMSPAQARVARAGVTEAMKNQDIKLYGVEGDDDSNWLLIDFWDVVIHLFRPETRKYYNLEALWADLPWWPGEVDV
jgi:ribosome-associated protein